MSAELYLAYVLACIVVVLIPGPTMTLVVANSLAHGTRAGLINVLGTQAGLAVMIGIVLLGLASIVETMGWWFDWIRLAGAAYLVWLGWKLLRASDRAGRQSRAPRPRGGFFLQGLLVALSNPKQLLFFGAFIPQFLDPAGDYGLQAVLLGATAMATAAVGDGIYAALGGRAGRLVSGHHVRLLSRAGGGLLIGGGIWLALARAR